jgi:hypothetical protein
VGGCSTTGLAGTWLDDLGVVYKDWGSGGTDSITWLRTQHPEILTQRTRRNHRRFLAHLSPKLLAGMSAKGCQAALLLDRVENDVSARRQSQLDTQKVRRHGLAQGDETPR